MKTRKHHNNKGRQTIKSGRLQKEAARLEEKYVHDVNEWRFRFLTLRPGTRLPYLASRHKKRCRERKIS